MASDEDWDDDDEDVKEKWGNEEDWENELDPFDNLGLLDPIHISSLEKKQTLTQEEAEQFDQLLLEEQRQMKQQKEERIKNLKDERMSYLLTRLHALKIKDDIITKYDLLGFLNEDIFEYVDKAVNLSSAYRNYQVSGFSINRMLFQKSLTDTYKETVETLDQMFREIPSISKTITVYRGIKIQDESQIEDKYGYISVSLSKDLAKSFASGGILLEIVVSAKTKVIPIFILKQRASFDREIELLLDRNGVLVKDESATEIIDGLKVIYCIYLPPTSQIIN